MKALKSLFFLLVMLQGFSAYSQSDCKYDFDLDYAKSYWKCGLTISAQPIDYKWQEWMALACVAGVSTLSFVYDDEILDFVNANFDVGKCRRITRYTDVLGEEVFIAPALLGMYALSACNKECELRQASLAGLQAFLFSEGVSAVVKVLACRHRPDQALSSNEWDGPFETFSSTSFLSGHACRSFALAATMAGLYDDKPWVGVVAYSCAVASCAGRLLSQEHWSSDVLVGAALGYFIGRGVVKFQSTVGKSENYTLLPYSGEYGVGVALKF
jgi:PAP2 superfamily.